MRSTGSIGLFFTASGCGNFISRHLKPTHCSKSNSQDIGEPRITHRSGKYRTRSYDASARISRGTTFMAIICSRNKVTHHQHFCVRTRLEWESSVTSWNSSLAAYGIVSCAIFLELLQYVHHPLYPISPQSSQAFTSNLSEEIMSRSSSSWVAPYPMRQSLSISPRRKPPSRDRPSVGCRVSVARGPLKFNETGSTPLPKTTTIRVPRCH